MLAPRLIPCLLMRNGALVKTFRFGDQKYVGDPINAVRIFNEKQADELMVLDIDATVKEEAPNFNVIYKLARECQMPLTYGGGVKTVDQIKRIISLGVEKVSISSAAIENPELVKQAVKLVGAQSIVATIDLKRSGLRRSWSAYTHNGSRKVRTDPGTLVKRLQELGVGEIVLNNIERDGMQNGYDLTLVNQLCEGVAVPITVLGGAGERSHISELWRLSPYLGAAAGSLFVFKGKYKAVLISYPNSDERHAMHVQMGSF